MKWVKFIFSLAVSLLLILGLGTGWTISGISIPPLGHFFNPFQGFWQNAENKALPFENTVDMKGLHAEVSVKYDSILIPHIFAKNDHDLYFAQGYVTASLRLWQMEFQAYAAAGRLSEVVGDATLEMDRRNRRLGMVYGAKIAEETWKNDPNIKALVEAYTAGVNAYINTLDYKSLPIEYKLLDYKPEKWTFLKCALMLKYMSHMLTGYEQDLENTNVLQLFGRKKFDMLFPNKLQDNDPVIPTTTTWDFEVKTPVKSDSIFYSAYTANTLPTPSPHNGSNNWAVSGKKTSSGYPILANDMHLGLNFPPIWFLVQLSAPGVNVFGNSLPGIPLIITGFNDSIAWAFTNANRDLKDWYKVKFKDEKRLEYQYDNQWHKTKSIIEKISIKGKATFYDTVVYTHIGPVVYDRAFGNNRGKTNYALKWLAHLPSYEPRMFYDFNRAKNYNDLKKTLKHFNCPPQNMTFATAQGDIATWIQGKFPIKWQDQGRFLLDGNNPKHEWREFIPQEQNAHIINPDRGFVSSANQYPTDSLYPYFIYNANYEHYRNRRINQRLSEMENITVEDMMALQNDNYNLKAAEITPILLKNLNQEQLSKDEKRLLETLKSWDYNFSPEDAAPTLFDMWWKKLYSMVWDELKSDSVKLRYPSSYNTYYLMKTQPDNEFFDVDSTEVRETLPYLVHKSFKETSTKFLELETSNDNSHLWQYYNNVRIVHATRVLKPFSTYHIHTGGEGSSVRANDGNHGASQRLIVAFGPELKAWTILPGGQSGNPGSYYYDNMVSSWAIGQYIPVELIKSKEIAKKEFLFSQKLIPNQKK